jgi:hypothetical protein
MSRARHGKLTDTFIESLSPQEGGRERIVRDGAVPGFLIRVGLRKRTFELRIEKPPKITLPVGHWPDQSAVDARRKAEDLWDTPGDARLVAGAHFWRISRRWRATQIRIRGRLRMQYGLRCTRPCACVGIDRQPFGRQSVLGSAWLLLLGGVM